MKKITGIICFCVVLLMGGCASTGGGSNTPFYEDWVVVEIADGSIRGVPLSRIQGSDNREYSQFSHPFNSQEIRLGSRNPSGLEPLNIIMVWYKKDRHGRNILERFEITGRYVREEDPAVIARREAAEAQRVQQAERETERQQPRFSPEGQEYVRRSLLQAAGEAANPANRGKTLFFETANVGLSEGLTTGQWLVREGYSNTPTIMYYYDTIRVLAYSILYRAEISSIGTVRYVIDSFRM